MIRNATLSSENVRFTELATFAIRILKFAFDRFVNVQLRPHVSVVPPRIYVVRLVVSVGVVLAVVQEEPPFQDSCTHIAGVFAVLSASASRRTSIPLIATPAGRLMP